MRWYVLHALSGHEEKVAQALAHMQEAGQLGEEIAEILEVPLGPVKVRIFRARAALAKILADRLGEEEE